MRKPLPFEEAVLMAELVRHRYYTKGDSRGARADLSFRNVSGLDLSKQILTNIILRGANLAGTNLSQCDLSGADFFGADLEGADMHDATLTGADFRGANLSRTILSGSRLQGADFSAGGATGTENARLTEAKLDHALLCQANMNGCDMSGAELIDADLSGADLSRAVMVGAELSGATLDGVKLNNTVLELSRLSHAQIQRMGSTDGIVERSYEFVPPAFVQMSIRRHSEWMDSGGKAGKRLELEGVKVTDVSFRKASLAGARLRRCSLDGLDLTGVVLDMADMAYSTFRDVKLSGASLKGAILRGADLSRADLSGAHVEAMTLQGKKSWPANLDGAILRDADLTRASFSGAIMNYADLQGCALSGASFIDVDLSKVKGSSLASSVTAISNRRTSTRYTEPKVFVKTPLGVFPAVNWSFSGVCLSYSGVKRFVPDSRFPAKLVGDKHPPPRDATFIVVKDDEQRGVALLKFADMDAALSEYLESLVP